VVAWVIIGGLTPPNPTTIGGGGGGDGVDFNVDGEIAEWVWRNGG